MQIIPRKVVRVFFSAVIPTVSDVHRVGGVLKSAGSLPEVVAGTERAVAAGFLAAAEERLAEEELVAVGEGLNEAEDGSEEAKSL